LFWLVVSFQYDLTLLELDRISNCLAANSIVKSDDLSKIKSYFLDSAKSCTIVNTWSCIGFTSNDFWFTKFHLLQIFFAENLVTHFQGTLFQSLFFDQSFVSKAFSAFRSSLFYYFYFLSLYILFPFWALDSSCIASV
jgi:hypothetical protein